MGLFLHLYLNPQGIAPEQWEAVYQESLTLLRKFPAPLMRLKHEVIRSKKRAVYTADIVSDAGTPDEHWMVIGDLISSQQAEDFRLYRALATQFERRREGNARDVLWAAPDALDYVDGNGPDLFGNKTQGYPYHLAMLAVAILFEIRFPEKCYLFGDIERIQVEQMSQWVHHILDAPVITPVCLDGRRLYQRLRALYADPRQAIARFQTLFRGTDEEQFETLLRYADQAAVFDVFIEDLSHYTSLSQYGAIHLAAQFLVVTQDLKQLIDLVLRAAAAKDKKSKDFTLEALLTMLCNEFLTIAPQEREPLEVFVHAQETLLTIEDTFAQLFMKLRGAPSAIDVYMDSAAVLETFCSYQPEKRASFQEIIRTGEQHCREELAQTRTLISEIERKMQEAAQRDAGESQAPAVVQAPPDGFGRKDISAEEAYILKQVALQTQRFHDTEESLRQIGEHLRQVIAKYPDRFASDERNDYLEGIYAASFENGFALRESAWQAIDQEENLTILKSLFAYALLTEREINFWRWRIHIFESRQLWKDLIEAHDQEMLAD